MPPFSTLPLDRDIWRAYTSLPFHLAGVPRNLKSEAHDKGKISRCVAKRERGGTRDRGILLWRKERRDEKGEGRKDAKPKRRANDSSFIHSHTHTGCRCRGEREEETRSRGEVRRRTIPRTLKRLCNPSQLHYLATPCVPFHPLSRDRGLCSFAAKLLARLPAARSRFPVSDLPYIDILVERVWISIDIQKGRNTKNSI